MDARANKRLVDDLYKTFIRAARRGSLAPGRQVTAFSRSMHNWLDCSLTFSQNVLEDEKRFVTWIEDGGRSNRGLPESVIAAIDEARADRSGAKPGQKWAVTNTRSSMDPFLTYAENREVERKPFGGTYYSRCDNGDDHSTTTRSSARFLALRRERAKMLGYPTHAHWRLEDDDGQEAGSRPMELMDERVAQGRRNAFKRRSC